MNKHKAQLIKEELINLLEKQTPLTNDSIVELIKFIENKYPKSVESQDTTPMIGTNPFKKTTKKEIHSKKDFNESLNYRVNKND